MTTTLYQRQFEAATRLAMAGLAELGWVPGGWMRAGIRLSPGDAIAALLLRRADR